MPKIRTFICIELAEKVRQRIADLQTDLKKYNAKIRWVNPKSIHLTLKFLGDVDEHSINDIAYATETACQGISPISIGINQTGAFPNFRRPRVLWVGVDEPTGFLLQLAKNIEKELAELGYPKEKRKFSPHLTIGRIKSLLGVECVTRELQDINFDAGRFDASEVVVMKSDLQPSRAVYTPLRKIKLNRE